MRRLQYRNTKRQHETQTYYITSSDDSESSDDDSDIDSLFVGGSEKEPHRDRSEVDDTNALQEEDIDMLQERIQENYRLEFEGKKGCVLHCLHR